MLKVVSIQTVKSKLKRYVTVENHTNTNVSQYNNTTNVNDVAQQVNLSATTGPDRGQGYDITKNMKFAF